MKSIERAVLALCLAALSAFPLAAGATTETGRLGAVEAIQIATDAYIFGYSLVTFLVPKLHLGTGSGSPVSSAEVGG